MVFRVVAKGLELWLVASGFLGCSVRLLGLFLWYSGLLLAMLLAILWCS